MGGLPQGEIAVSAIDETHDPARGSWVDGAGPESDFPVQNLPLGIFSEAKGLRRPGVAISPPRPPPVRPHRPRRRPA